MAVSAKTIVRGSFLLLFVVANRPLMFYDAPVATSKLDSKASDTRSVGELPNEIATLTRGPYLQMGTPASIVIRWRTGAATNSRVRYGAAPNNLTAIIDDSVLTNEHEVAVAGLTPNTRYYYSVGSTEDTLASGPDYFFITAPPAGAFKKTRIWVLGDAGSANSKQEAVRNAYYSFTDTIHTDLWVMLGDNAYEDGTDAEYQAAVFDMYPQMLRKSVLWPAFGNHDAGSASSQDQSGVFYEIFTLPAHGEAGGVASGTEAYYSFDFANVHFICLNSHDVSRKVDGEMLTWLRNDLATNTQSWTIAFWHHPPYTKGSHNSDTQSQLVQMRENALPILEAGGVDLVLTGHSHSYERSFLLDEHYGVSTTLQDSMILDRGDGRIGSGGAYTKPTFGPASHEGAVYVVAGSSGKTSGGSLNHPAMHISFNVLGSVVLEVTGDRLDATFLDHTRNILDYFTISKGQFNVVSDSLPAGRASCHYSATLEAEHNIGALQWEVVADSLPEGLSLERTTGKISGTPTVAGEFAFTIQVRDELDSTRIATRAFSIAITEGCLAGDVTLDENVTMFDALVIASHFIALPVAPEFLEQIRQGCGDVTRDQTTTSVDALVIATHAVGLPVAPFSVGQAMCP